jgi:hypothetical protein
MCLAIGVNWCAVYTSQMNLRLFSLTGVQRIVLSVSQVITMAGYESYLAYVYHSGTPLFGTQSLRVRIINLNEFREVYDGIMPISAHSTLSWFGFSEGNF